MLNNIFNYQIIRFSDLQKADLLILSFNLSVSLLTIFFKLLVEYEVVFLLVNILLSQLDPTVEVLTSVSFLSTKSK